MEIRSLGHSSFRIRGKKTSVVTDPFEGVGFTMPKVKADIVTISHDHGDHNNASAVNDVKKIVNGPGEYEIQGVSIIGIPSYHDDEKGVKRGKNTIYVFEIGIFRLAHLGDLGHVLREKDVEAIGDIDVLMIPVGGVYTIGPKDAVKVVQDIEPRIIIPMHYQQKGLDSQMFGELTGVEEFTKELGSTGEKMPKLKLISKPTDEQKVVILEK